MLEYSSFCESNPKFGEKYRAVLQPYLDSSTLDEKVLSLKSIPPRGYPSFTKNIEEVENKQYITLYKEKMKDAILTSEWAERWPGARTAGCSPSSPPPSLCSLVLFMPVSPPASFRAGPGDPFPSDTWESSRIPESTQGVLRGNKSTFPGLDGAAIQASGASSWVSRLGHLHVTQRCPAALARPPPPLLGRVSTDLAHGAFFPS